MDIIFLVYRRYLKLKKELKSNFSIVKGHFKDAGMQIHFHEEYSIGIFYGGEYEFDFNKQNFIVKPGDLRIINPYELHKTNKGSWDYIHISLNPKILNTIYSDIKQKEFEGIIKLKTIKHDFKAINIANCLFNSKAKNSDLEMEKSLYNMANYLLTNYTLNPIETIDKLIYNKRQMLNAIDFIEENLDDRSLTIEQIAKSINLSPFYFTRSFKKEFGISPYQFIINKRLERAKKLLRGDFPIAEIAYMCGFSDQSHLTRVFKKYFGFTPGKIV